MKRQEHISFFVVVPKKFLKHNKLEMLRVWHWYTVIKSCSWKITMIYAASWEISTFFPLRRCRTVSSSLSLPIFACREILLYHFLHFNGCSFFLYKINQRKEEVNMFLLKQFKSLSWYERVNIMTWCYF